MKGLNKGKLTDNDWISLPFNLKIICRENFKSVSMSWLNPCTSCCLRRSLFSKLLFNSFFLYVLRGFKKRDLIDGFKINFNPCKIINERYARSVSVCYPCFCSNENNYVQSWSLQQSRAPTATKWWLQVISLSTILLSGWTSLVSSWFIAQVINRLKRSVSISSSAGQLWKIFLFSSIIVIKIEKQPENTEKLKCFPLVHVCGWTQCLDSLPRVNL